MTGTQISSEGLDPRRRRLLFRSWHRGIREMDLVLGRFADAHIATLSVPELDEYERAVAKAMAHDGGAAILDLAPSDRLTLIGPWNLPETNFGNAVG